MSEPARALMSETACDSATVVEASAPDFDAAFVLHHRAVYRTAYALLHDAGLAEDVTQEVFLRLYRQLDQRPPAGEHLRPWLLRVAINLAHNTRRGRQRAAARDEEFAMQATSGDLGAATTTALDAEYERQTEIEQARRALERIDEPMRSCLLLKQQGLSYREIAATVSVNENYVGSLIARGRKEFVRVYSRVAGGQGK